MHDYKKKWLLPKVLLKCTTVHQWLLLRLLTCVFQWKKNGGTPVQVYKNRYKHMTNPSMVLPKLLNKCRYITVQKKVYISNGTTIPCAMYQCKKRKCTKFVLYTYLVWESTEVLEGGCAHWAEELGESAWVQPKFQVAQDRNYQYLRCHYRIFEKTEWNASS